MIARCIALGLPIEWVPIRTIYAGEPSHIRPWRHLTQFVRVSRDARRIARGQRAMTQARRPASAGRAWPASSWRRSPSAASWSGSSRRWASTTPPRPTCSRSSRWPSCAGPGRRSRPRSARSSPTTSSSSSRPTRSRSAIPAEWLNLLLLLVVGIVVGRLAGPGSATAPSPRSKASARRRRCSTSASRSRANATWRPPSGRSPMIVRDETRAGRVWITVGDALVADTAAARLRPPTAPLVHVVLRRRPGDEPAEWVRVHAPGRGGKSGEARPRTRPIASRSPPAIGPSGRSGWRAHASSVIRTRARRG